MTIKKPMDLSVALREVKSLVKKFEALDRLGNELGNVSSLETWVKESTAAGEKAQKEAEAAKQKAENAKAQAENVVASYNAKMAEARQVHDAAMAKMETERELLGRKIKADTSEANQIADMLADLKAKAHAKLAGLA